MPPSRPKPLSLTPPNGVSATEASRVLIDRLPASIDSLSWSTFLAELVKA
jgi:hypothetical protein